MDYQPHDARFQALMPRALALVASDALRELSPEQEFVARADLREGGTANSRVLAALLDLPMTRIQDERRDARRKILQRVRHLLGDGGWSSLVTALKKADPPETLLEEMARPDPAGTDRG